MFLQRAGSPSPKGNGKAIMVPQHSQLYTVMLPENDIASVFFAVFKVCRNHDTRLLALDNPGRVGIDYKATECLVWWTVGVICCPCQYKVPMCHSTISDPHLLSIQHVLVALADCFRTDPGDVRSSAGLRYTVRLQTFGSTTLYGTLTRPSMTE